MAWHWKPAMCFSVNVRNCICIVAALHLLNTSCKITQQILLTIFPDFISPPGGTISFNISGFSKKGQKAFKWIKIHLMKHSIKEIKEKNQTRVTIIQRGGGRVLSEEACLRDQPLTLCMYHFRQKRYPFRGEPLCLGHHSTPSSCTENSAWYSDVVWYELHQTFRAHEEVLSLFYDNFHFSSKEREGYGVPFLGDKGGGLIEDLRWVRILHSIQSNGFYSGKGRQGYFIERQMATVRLWSLLIRVRKMSE